ncbi:MAG: hypothetical protein AAGE76_01290 [Pseudomonadota bacterium]
MTDEIPQMNMPPPKVAFDWQEFLPHLAESDLSEDQKRAFIETMWQIVLAFVDLGFEVGTPQESCGEAIDLNAALQRAIVSSDHQEKGDAA